MRNSQSLIEVLFIILFLSGIPYSLPAADKLNNPPSFDHETRAVWVATNHRLDWPPNSFDADIQKEALSEIFSNIKSKFLNTIYFQVRSNGTVMFKSTLDPYSPYITGRVNGEPEYDPLQYAVELAHKKGLEIHAWVNCLNVFAGNESNIFKSPDHISRRKPEWIIEYSADGSNSLWLDPGLPEVREYVSDLITEMVENYDIDGVHLDYIRYPGREVDDDFSFGIYGNGMNLDDWRRKNITELIGLINKKIKEIKPYVKLGATPIGVYKNQKGMYALEGFSDVYQDSHEWLSSGIVDYVTPQIYWGLHNNPRFDIVAKDWADNSSGRNVVLGIGAYKDNIKNEIGQLIQYSRTIGASGIAFYRYSSIKNYDFKNFSYRTFPAEMVWLDGINPSAPTNLEYKIDRTNQNVITLNWDISNSKSKDTVKYYALYNLPAADSQIKPDYLFDIISSDKSSVALAVKPKKINYFFTLKSVSKLWNESVESSNTIEVKFNKMSSLANLDDWGQNPMLLKETDRSAKILLYSANEDTIEIVGDDGIKQQGLLTEELHKGKNIISLSADLSKFKLIKIIYESSKREVELKL